MKRTLTVVAAVASTIFIAGCTSSSSTPTTSAAVTSGVVTSAGPGSGTPGATGSGSVSATAAVSDSAAAAGLDAASTTWLHTYCAGVAPVNSLAGIQTQVQAAKGDLPQIRTLMMQAFQTAGTALTSTAAQLKGLPAPALTAAGSDLPAVVAKFSSLGASMTADGQKFAAVNPNDPKALAMAMASYAPDLDQMTAALGAPAGLEIPAASMTEAKAIPACGDVLS